ncbi:MAG: thioesterase family protein [bacterium]
MTTRKSDLPSIIEQVKTVFEQQIPFNKLLQMEVEALSFEGARLRIEMRDELVGNFIHGILHGGVISTMLDVTGGLTAFMGLLQKMGPISNQEKVERLSKFGTIDLRVDYLRPGRGTYFISRGALLRTGNKVAVTRMELHNDDDELIALGTGTYLSV